jgi:hypothetical protein
VQPRRLYEQLKGVSADVVTIDTTTANLVASFKFDNVTPKQGREWCYAEKVRLYIRTQIDQPASGGAIIRPDQLYRMIQSIKLSCDDLGTIYGPGDLNGPALGLIAQIVSNGYRQPFFLRDDIAAADGDTAVVLVVEIPIAHECFFKGHQTAIWNGFLKRGGSLDVTFASSTAFGAVSTGAVQEQVTDIRAELVSLVEPEARPPTIWTWRMRDTTAGDVKATIHNLGQGSGITGASGVGKVAFLALLSNLNGLGGASTMDQIQRIFPRDRGQGSHSMGAPFYGAASLLYDFVSDTRDKRIFPGTGQGHAYPYALGTQVNGQSNAATALFLPFIWPDVEGQQVSKLQEVSGDYYVELDYSTPPATNAKWLSLEQSYLTAEHEAFLMGDRMGLPPGQFRAYPKVRGLNAAGDQQGQLQQQQKLRGIPKKIRQA